MDKRARAWDSLSYSYGNMAEQSNANYAKQISQQNNSMLARGMQRSSYAGQIEAGLRSAQVKAANDIEAQKIAAYEERLGQIEQQEQEQANWEAQFNENKRQFDENLGLQKEQFAETKEQNAWNRTFQESESAREQSNTDRAYELQREQMSIQQEQWKAEFDFNSKTQEQQYYANFVMSSIQAGNDPTDEMLAKAGLSRADANSMKAQVSSGGGGGGGSYKAKTDNGKDKKGLNLGDLDADAKNIWEGLNDTTETRERGKKLAQKINKG